MSDRSSITNCHFILRGNDPLLFDFDGEGRAIVQMDQMLICPKEMFTQRQIKQAWRKWKATAERATHD